MEITYKPNYKVSDRPRITTSKEAYDILIEQWNTARIDFLEEFKIILLNRRNRVLGVVHISSGRYSSTIVDPKLIFGAAIKSCASGIVLCHNHPSTETDPSQEDIVITSNLKMGGKLLNIEVMDHLIISNFGYYSFADEGIL